MNVQEAKELEITEGNVRTIHASDGKLLWGRLAYDTNYGGDTTQQTYSGKNKMPVIAGSTSLNGIDITIDTEGVITINGTSTDSLNIKITNGVVSNTTSTIPSSWLNDSIGDVNNKTLSIIYQSGTFAGTGVAWRIFKDTTSYSYQWYPSSSTITQSFTSSQTMSCFVFFIGANKTFTDYKVKVQLEDGGTATSYEPYVGGIPAPNPDYPQTIKIATGTQSITLSDEVISEDYTLSLGSTELCKIGDYQDYIYKSGDDWYVHKAIGKNNSLNSVSWHSNGGQGDTTNGITFYYTGSAIPKVNGETTFYSNYFSQVPAAIANNDHTLTDFMTSASAGATVFNVKRSRLSTQDTAGFQSWLSQNGVVLYYPLATPTDTQITDTTLISQLEAVQEFLTRYGYQSTVTGDIPLIINQTALV